MNCKPSFFLLLAIVAAMILGGCASAPEPDHSSRYTLA
ncbi:septal ring lytic transglycosylase RlpA, partial [Marinobacter sp. B9-2]